LRKTYNQRLSKALLLTGALCLTIFAGAKLMNSISPARIETAQVGPDVFIQEFEEEKKKEPEPEPIEIKQQKTADQPQEQPRMVDALTKQFSTPLLEEHVDKPAPTAEELDKAKIGLTDNPTGLDLNHIPLTDPIGKSNGIVEAPKNSYGDDNTIRENVEIPASYPGGPAAWKRFLERNLDRQVGTDNGAPAGAYTVIVQFVVDKQGNVSDLKPITAHGYGLEAEAVRVLKKALQWNPAIQNGFAVKAYKKQPVTFQIGE
ncbi:MAG: energy transducer TonB, partial [Chryseobacterium sp.]